MEEFEGPLKVLIEQAWEREITWNDVEAWAGNLTGRVAPVEDEKRMALFMLTRFMYFGKGLVREMLKSVYREHFEGPLLQRIRRNMANTRNYSAIRLAYQSELSATRFVGVGNPAESGAHLLYYFRQVNCLSKTLFTDLSGAFMPLVDPVSQKMRYRQKEMAVTRYVFFDDLVGSGTQATSYLKPHIKLIRKAYPNIELRFISLFATKEGLMALQDPDFFGGRATCLYELDDSFKAFEAGARYFKNAPTWFSESLLKRMCEEYGKDLWPRWPLGYKDGQVLLGFSHNTPDNTPPLFWMNDVTPPWMPIFIRYHKKY